MTGLPPRWLEELNENRFLSDFVLHLSPDESKTLRCQNVTLKRGGADVTIATVAKTPITQTAIEKFNKQNPTLTVKAVAAFHDRFLILDEKELYHFGASLKDLGHQYCAVTRMDAMFISSIMERI